MFILGVFASSELAEFAGAQTYTVTGPSGASGTITVAVSVPASQPTTNPVTPPVVTTQPTTQPTTEPAGQLPGMASAEPYASDAWLATFGRESTGNINLAPLIPANACYVWNSSCPWKPNVPASQIFADYNSAQNAAIANGSLCILFCDGGTYASSVLDNNIQGATGTATHPFIISRIGPNGFTDHSLPRPLMVAGHFGIAGSVTPGVHNWGGPIHYVILDGLNFDCVGQTQPAGAALVFVDESGGSPSDHIGYFDISITGYMEGMDIEADDGYPNTTVVLDGCDVYNNRGPNSAATAPGAYFMNIFDLLINRSYFIGNGVKNQLATAHDIYIDGVAGALAYKTTTNSQRRIIDTVLGTAAADGCECNAGGFFDHVLSLANPIAFYGGGAAPTWIKYCVVDGGGGEFDTSAVQFASGQGFAQQAGGTLSAQPGTAGCGRGWGAYSDCATMATIQYLYCINKNDAGDMTAGNVGFPVGVNTTDSGKNPEGMPTATTNATIGPYVIVHNWGQQINGQPVVLGQNQLELSTNAPPLPSGLTFVSPVVIPGTTPTTIIEQLASGNTIPMVGTANVLGVEPTYVDNTRTSSSYAKTLGISGVQDGPTLLEAMEGQNSANWNPALEAQNVVNYVAAGFTLK